jgi:hypothetical protein
MGQQSAQIKSDVPLSKFMLDHILTGDSGDGIPNVLSKRTFFKDKVTDEAAPQRQKPVTATIKAFYQAQIDEHGEVKEFRDEHNKEKGKIVSSIAAADIQERFEFNDKLINFDNIPADVKRGVIASYKSQLGKDRSQLLDYFVRFKLKNLMPMLQDF